MVPWKKNPRLKKIQKISTGSNLYYDGFSTYDFKKIPFKNPLRKSKILNKKLRVWKIRPRRKWAPDKVFTIMGTVVGI